MHHLSPSSVKKSFISSHKTTSFAPSSKQPIKLVSPTSSLPSSSLLSLDVTKKYDSVQDCEFGTPIEEVLNKKRRQESDISDTFDNSDHQDTCEPSDSATLHSEPKRKCLTSLPSENDVIAQDGQKEPVETRGSSLLDDKELLVEKSLQANQETLVQQKTTTESLVPTEQNDDILVDSILNQVLHPPSSQTLIIDKKDNEKKQQNAANQNHSNISTLLPSLTRRSFKASKKDSSSFMARIDSLQFKPVKKF